MKMRILVLNLFVIAVAVLCSGAGFAADTAPMMDGKMAGGNAVPVVVEGTNACLGCSLMKEGAHATCDKNGHQQALKVTKATTADGKPLPEVEGWTLHYLNNAQGMELSNGAKFHGKTLTLTGTLFKDERVLDVSKVDAKDMADMKGMDKSMDKPMDKKMKEPMTKKPN
jgi:hypothetical protein